MGPLQCAELFLTCFFQGSSSSSCSPTSSVRRRKWSSAKSAKSGKSLDNTDDGLKEEEEEEALLNSDSGHGSVKEVEGMTKAPESQVTGELKDVRNEGDVGTEGEVSEADGLVGQ